MLARTMVADRSRYGLFIAAVGAIVLAVSVFLPWYGLSLTASGVALVQQIGDQVAAQYGNASLQSLVAGSHQSIASLAGQPLAAVSAHDALKDMNILLLVLAGLALLDALVPLVRAPVLPAGAGASLVLIGTVAAACVAYRMVSPPQLEGGFVALSLREAEEEIGLARGDVTLLGSLPPVSTFATNYVIHPFVAEIPAGLRWSASAREVDAVLELPVDALRAGRTRTRMERRGISFETDAYVVEDHLIWGATARIIEHLFERLAATSSTGSLTLG